MSQRERDTDGGCCFSSAMGHGLGGEGGWITAASFHSVSISKTWISNREGLEFIIILHAQASVKVTGP